MRAEKKGIRNSPRYNGARYKFEFPWNGLVKEL